jgi:hypothetical protein
MTRFDLLAWVIMAETDSVPHPTVQPKYMAELLERLDRLSDDELRSIITHPDYWPTFDFELGQPVEPTNDIVEAE